MLNDSDGHFNRPINRQFISMPTALLARVSIRWLMGRKESEQRTHFSDGLAA